MNKLAVVSIAIAILIPLLMAFKSHTDISSNPVVKIKISAYDPRDLLRGHYMRFQYNWNWDQEKQKEKNCEGNHCCLCVEAKEVDPKVYVQECRIAKTNASCAHIIRGQSWGDANFFGPPQEYYVDENIALPLEKFFQEQHNLQDFYIGLSLPPSGKAKIENLYIGGKSLSDYITEHGAEFTIPKNGVEPSQQQ
jgi:hypothetical protein